MAMNTQLAMNIDSSTTKPTSETHSGAVYNR